MIPELTGDIAQKYHEALMHLRMLSRAVLDGDPFAREMAISGVAHASAGEPDFDAPEPEGFIESHNRWYYETMGGRHRHPEYD